MTYYADESRDPTFEAGGSQGFVPAVRAGAAGQPRVSRERLERGELQQVKRELSSREYAIPDSKRRHLGEKTIEAWYYAILGVLTLFNVGKLF